MSLMKVLKAAQQSSQGPVTVFSLQGNPRRNTLLDYGELSAWVDERVNASLITRTIRVELKDGKFFEYCFFDKDFFCLFLRSTPLDRVAFRAPGYLIFRLLMEGEMVQLSGSDSKDIAGVSSTILSPSDAALGWTSQSSGAEGVTGAVIFCRPEALFHRLEQQGESLESPVVDLVARSNVSYSKVTTPCTQDMVRFGSDLMATDFAGPLARLRCEGLALLLVAEFLRSYGQLGHRAGSTVQIGGRDVQRLNQVRDWILAHYADELTIGGLSRRAGLNRNKLTEGFRELYGTTVQGFILEQRMHAALALLRDDLPLDEIAERVGYGSAASLARAFKRFFGVPPRRFVGAAH